MRIVHALLPLALAACAPGTSPRAASCIPDGVRYDTANASMLRGNFDFQSSQRGNITSMLETGRLVLTTPDSLGTGDQARAFFPSAQTLGWYTTTRRQPAHVADGRLFVGYTGDDTSPTELVVQRIGPDGFSGTWMIRNNGYARAVVRGRVPARFTGTFCARRIAP